MLHVQLNYTQSMYFMPDWTWKLKLWYTSDYNCMKILHKYIFRILSSLIETHKELSNFSMDTTELFLSFLQSSLSYVDELASKSCQFDPSSFWRNLPQLLSLCINDKSMKLHFILIILYRLWTYLGLNSLNFLKSYIMMGWWSMIWTSIRFIGVNQ